MMIKNRDFVRDDAFRENSENKYSYKRFKEIDQRGKIISKLLKALIS